MAPKISDEVLEKLYCDFCYKFLSVKPVKIFPGKKIKCGRCSNDGGDKGVVSLYELIADQYVFPCINRYDGCDELLAPFEVLTHEQTCKSKYYVCPICQCEEIPTFLVTRHFRENHREALLDTPDFSLVLKESLPIEQWFLFEFKHKLFFTHCSSNGLGKLTMSVIYLGVNNESEKLTHMFILYSRRNRIITDTKLCIPYNQMNSEELTIDMSQFDKKDILNVYVHIKISRILLPEVPVNRACGVALSAWQTSALSRPFKLNSRTNKERKNASLIELNFSEYDLIRPRTIFLNSTLRNLNILSFGSTFDHCIHSSTNKKIYLQCFKCGELRLNHLIGSVLEQRYIEYNSEYLKYIDTFEINDVLHLKCRVCCLDNSFKRTKFMELNQFRLIHLFCIWNCNQTIPIDKIFDHEVICDKQPFRLCPLDSCTMKGKLFEIQDHFKEHKPKYSLLFNSEVFVKLFPSKPPIRSFLMFRNVFVFFELTWSKFSWRLKFRLCREKHTFAGMKLKAVIFDSLKFLKSGEQPQIIEFHHMEQVQIKFYLEK